MLKVYGAFLVLLLALLIVGNYGATHGFIAVSVSGNQPVTITITNQKTNSVITAKTSNGHFKKLMPSGAYEVYVTSSPKTAWRPASVGRFFTSAAVTVNSLHDEAGREIVGYEPGPCMNYISDTFSSYTCNASLDTLKLQVPPDANTPTIASTPIANSNLGVSNIVPTPAGLVGLVTSNDPEANFNQQSFLLLSADLKIINKVPIKGAVIYSEITPYKNGLLAHDRGFKHFTYFSSIDAAGVAVTVHAPKDTTLQPTTLSVLGNDFAVTYANTDDTDKGIESVVVVNRAGRETSYSLPSHTTTVKLCGTNQLCSLEPTNNKQPNASQWILSIYTTNAAKFTKDFSVANVDSFTSVSDGVVVARGDGILFVDPSNKTGYMQLSIANYGFCGMQSLGDAYLVCGSDKVASRNTAIHILPKQSVTVPIDQLVQTLEKNSAVKSVSVYKNNIAVVPNYGELVYDMSLHSYTYDQSKIDSTNNAVQQLLSTSQLGNNGYTITVIGQ